MIFGLTLLTHQFLSTIGAWFLALETSAFIHSFAPSAGFILTSSLGEFQSVYIRFFQLGIGGTAGWVNARFLDRRSALWVWIVPTLYLVVRMIVWRDPAQSVLASSGWLAPFQHFFGFGCYFPGSMSEFSKFAHPTCFDQLFVTGPFYTATAYSLGALLSTKRVLSRLGRSNLPPSAFP